MYNQCEPNGLYCDKNECTTIVELVMRTALISVELLFFKYIFIEIIRNIGFVEVLC